MRRCSFWLLLAILVTGPTRGEGDAIPVVTFTVSGFDVIGDNPLGAEVTDATLAPFLGQHQGLDGLLAAADALQARLGKAGYSFHRVLVPPQTLEAGRVTLEMFTIGVGQVRVEGNRYFSDENIRATFPTLADGVPPNARALSRNLMIANRHPAKDFNVRLRESDQAGSVDAVIRVTDQNPRRVFGSLNNIGTKQTGRTRLTVGVQDNNLWDRDHGATFSYTTSPEHDNDVEQWGLHYRLPMYDWGGAFTFFYTDSDVDAGTVAGIFDVTGSGEFFGVRYEQALLRVGALQQSLSLSLESRYFDNDILFGGTGFGSQVRSVPLEARYEVEYRHRLASLKGWASYARNLGWGGDNDSGAYAATRGGASEHWDLFRFGGDASIPLPEAWLGVLRMRAQLSDDALIPGEQFGLGGATTVRGYDEREVSGDSGYLLSAEAWAPKLPYNLRAFGFVDTGYRRNENVPGVLRDESLTSIGVGGFWQWTDRVYLTLQWGHTLEATAASDDGKDKLHFSLYARY